MNLILMHQSYYIPGVDPWLDTISTIGLAIGVIAAAYFKEFKQAEFRIWFVFVLYGVIFGLLAAEGGALDFFGPGVYRTIGLIALILVELFGVYSSFLSDQVATG